MKSSVKKAGPADGGTYLAKAQERWSAKMPDWVRELARAADAEAVKGGSLTSLGGKLTLSGSVLSAVIGKTYPGKSLGRIEAKVRGKLMSATVECPALGLTISRADCANNQAMKTSTASPDRFRLARTCPVCPNFLGNK